MNKICVLGSMNMDLVLKVKDMPKVGETILSKSFQKIAGGKGANQAVAAKRSGAEVFMISKENGKVTILNPAPAKKIKDELLNYTDIIVPNETEAELLTGIEIKDIEDAKKAGEIFLDKGVKFIIITLGEKGAALIGKDFCEIVPAYRVNAIDTTAAGDSFIGGLSSKLDTKNLGRETLSSSIRFGNKVSSIAVQRKGAQPSIPYLKEVLEVYKGEE